MRVLICDDDPVCRKMLHHKIQEIGYQVIGEANTGLSAINQFVELEPDIVLLDINMPQGGGLTVLRFMQELNPTIRIIMLTADSTQKSVQTALKLGAKDFLVKGVLNLTRLKEALKM